MVAIQANTIADASGIGPAPFPFGILTTGGKSNILGIVDGSNAPAGDIGEEITSGASPVIVAFSTLTNTNVTSITLTPGDWEIHASLCLSGNTNSATIIDGYVALASASSAGTTFGQDFLVGVNNGTAQAAIIVFPPLRKNITVTTTYYLNSSGTTATGGNYNGILRARRVR